jgi:hypothetical protein
MLLDRLVVAQMVKKFASFYGTRRFITVFIRARHWALAWASWIRSTASYRLSLRSILILSSHVRLNLPRGPFHWSLRTKFYMILPFSPRPEQLWGPPNLLFSGYQGLFPGVKRPGHEAHHPLYLVPRSKNAWSYTFTSTFTVRATSSPHHHLKVQITKLPYIAAYFSLLLLPLSQVWIISALCFETFSVYFVRKNIVKIDLHVLKILMIETK